MDGKSTWIPTLHWMDHVFMVMVTWIVFKNHLLEVGLTQNCWRSMALRTLTTVDLFGFNHVWGPTWIEVRWNSIWLKVWSHVTSHYIRVPVTTLRDVGSGFEMVFGHFLLGSLNFRVTAHGSCVKWPLDYWWRSAPIGQEFPAHDKASVIDSNCLAQ